jgi:hypothetical protein
VALGAILFVLGVMYATWAASRLDRLHARLDAAAAALDAQLRVRADAAEVFAASLPPELGTSLAAAVATARSAGRLDGTREVAESALTRALRHAVDGWDPDREPLHQLVDADTRASFARRFHNDAVRDALVVRRRWVVRLLHLAGHAPLPTYFEMDDAPLVGSDVTAASAPYDGKRE